MENIFYTMGNASNLQADTVKMFQIMMIPTEKHEIATSILKYMDT